MAGFPFKSVRTRILVFLISVITICLIAVAGMLRMGAQSAKTIANEEAQELFEVLRRTLELYGNPLEVLGFDYTYWDEMVACVRQCEPQWPQANIDTALATYDADVAWLYDADLKLVYANSSRGMDPSDWLTPELLQSLKGIVFAHFYLQSPMGLLELRTAPVQPSHDSERRTTPNGYFMVGRLWDKPRLDALSKVTGASIQLLPADHEGRTGHIDSNTEIAEVSLLDRFGAPVGRIVAARPSETLHQTALWVRQTIVAFVAFTGILLVMQFIFLTQSVVWPLKILAHSLSTQRPEELKPLLARKDEFGRLAELTEHFFQQKARLDQEVSEHKAAEEALRQAQADLVQTEKMRSVGQLAAGVAHEVKNPLAIILQGIEYLGRHVDASDETVRSVLADMVEAVRRADSVVHGLLDFSSPSRLRLEETEINQLIAHALNLVKHECVRNKIAVERSLQPGLPALTLDRNRIEQVLVNIFLNAIQAMKGGGTLTVTSTLTRFATVQGAVGRRSTDNFSVGEQALVVEIRDSGPGMDDSQLRRAFEPFFTTKGPGGGSGLGLAVCQGILNSHKGVRAIANHADGGLEVRIFFKLTAEA